MTETPYRRVPATDHVEIEGPSIQIGISSGSIIIHDGNASTAILSSEFASIRAAMNAAEKIERELTAEGFPVKGGE